jgi:hypothetical protein
MRRIRQHGPNKELFDIADLVPLVVEHRSITHWVANIEWALARSGEKSDSSAIQNQRYSTKGLLSLYQDIYQTVDGIIIAFDGDEEVVRLEAVDSSYWEVTADDEAILDSVERAFGLYDGI